MHRMIADCAATADTQNRVTASRGRWTAHCSAPDEFGGHLSSLVKGQNIISRITHFVEAQCGYEGFCEEISHGIRQAPRSPSTRHGGISA